MAQPPKKTPKKKPAPLRIARRPLTEAEREVAGSRLRELLEAWALLSTGTDSALSRALRIDDDSSKISIERLLAAAFLCMPQKVVSLGSFVGATVIFPQGADPAAWLREHTDDATVHIHVIRHDQTFAPALLARGLTDTVERLLVIMVEQLKLPLPPPTYELPRPQLKRLK